MTDTDTAAEETQQQQDSGNEDPKGLRKQLEQVIAENKELKAFKRSSAFEKAGFDLNSGEGKALAKLYEGEADPDAIRKFAADEFGWEPKAQDVERTEAETQREQAQGRVDQVTASSTSVEPPDDLQGQIAKAESDGDWARAGALKSQLLNTEFYKR